MLGAYRIVDLTDERGNLAAFVLAGLGADVVLVEPPAVARRAGVARSPATSRTRSGR